MGYTTDQISWIKAQCSLVELVTQLSSHPVRGSGKNLSVRCFLPGHNDKTPSFVVNTHKDTWRCYGSCGVGGDIIDLVQAYYQMDFIAAIEQLSEIFNFDLPDQEHDVDEDHLYRMSVYNAGNAYIDFCQADGRKELMEKYVEKRGHNKTLASLYRLGYHPRGLAVPDNIDLKLIGLNNGRMPKGKSLLEGRIIIPHLIGFKQPIAFYGRKHSRDTSDTPKYFNSWETKMYRKDQVLFNQGNASRGVQRRANKMALLMEGQFDTGTMPQFAYGKCGSALTKNQVRMMKRDGAASVCLVNDGDNAGRKSTIKDMRTILQEGLSVYAVAMPEGMDPDSYQNAGGDVADYVSNNMKDCVNYVLVNSESSQTGLKIDDALEILSYAHDPFVQQEQIKSLSKITGINRRSLIKRLEKISQ